MRKLIIQIRGGLFRAIAATLWAGWLPLGLRLALIRAVMARDPRGTGLSRQISLLASAVAEAGARAVARAPKQTARLIRQAQARGARVIVIAGDSHGRLYIHRARRRDEWLLPVHHLATAASARGLSRSGSRSGQGEAVTQLVTSIAQADLALPILLVFGQVDVEFIHVFKRLASEPPAPHDPAAFQAFARETVDSYITFAAQLSASTASPISLSTVFPPALSDDAWRQGYVNANITSNHADASLDVVRDRLRRTDIPSLAARTSDHALFNRLLMAQAGQRGLRVFDAASVLPTQNGGVDRALLGAAAGTDHHLDGEALRPYLTPLLWQLADGRG